MILARAPYRHNALVRYADRILVVENGRTAESGTHTEILAANGLYADLYRRPSRETVAPPDG
ncbi:MAG: hypothetical protein CYG60_19165 [Actinobacteria bacterium]|nr:hypothetical protein [Actinomycetota bacterium]PLS84211.1 MAG: hypothetical protein CYG60_19165 [Actinomycetota bacterium]